MNNGFMADRLDISGLPPLFFPTFLGKATIISHLRESTQLVFLSCFLFRAHSFSSLKKVIFRNTNQVS